MEKVQYVKEKVLDDLLWDKDMMRNLLFMMGA